MRYALKQQKQLSNERVVELNRIKRDSSLACSENRKNSVKVTVEQRVNIMATRHMKGYWARGRNLVCKV